MKLDHDIQGQTFVTILEKVAQYCTSLLCEQLSELLTNIRKYLKFEKY